MPLAVVSAFVTLGSKYDIERLHVAGKKALYQEFPTVLEDLNALGSFKFIEIDDHTSHWMQLAQLARKGGLLSVLPYVLYRCIQEYPATSLLRGIEQADGTVRRLAPEDQLACLEGHRRLVREQTNETFAWIYGSGRLSDECLRPKICNELLHELSKSRSTPEPVVSGLDLWNSMETGQLCAMCSDISEYLHTVGREALWERLPELLDLPPWSELQKERANV